MILKIITVYYWQGFSKSGQSCHGKTLEKDKQKIQSILRQQGVYTTKIKKKRQIIFYSLFRTRDILNFNTQLTRLLKAGLPLIEILRLLEKGTFSLAFTQQVYNLRFYLEKGYSFSDALSKLPNFYSHFHRQLIALGEKTATLEIVFLRITQHLKKTYQLQTKLISALLYPILVITLSTIIFLLLLIGVVPQFQQLFTEVGAQLPFLTHVIITLSELIQNYFFIIFFIVILLSIIILFVNRKTDWFFIKKDKLFLCLFGIKNLYQATLIARCTRLLAIALASGLPLIEALYASALCVQSPLFKKAILSSCDLIKNGENFHHALQTQKIIPQEVIQLIRLGELSGKLADILKNIAEIYEEKIDFFLENASKLIEPFLMLFLGGMVSSVIIAMYLPIFKLGSVI